MRRLLRARGPSRTATADGGPRSTPAWCRPLALDGQEVVTAEGLGTPDDLHPVQPEMAVRGGSQCGYCTPGFVCSMAAEYYRPDRGRPTRAGRGANGFDLHAIAGNLCRCTGYRPIRDAAYALGAPPADDPLADRRGSAPPRRPVPTRRRRRFARPADLAEALALLRDRPTRPSLAGSHRLGRRGQPARRARAATSSRSTSCPSCGPARRRRARDRDRRGADAHPRSSAALDGRVPLLDEVLRRSSRPG